MAFFRPVLWTTRSRLGLAIQHPWSGTAGATDESHVAWGICGGTGAWEQRRGAGCDSAAQVSMPHVVHGCIDVSSTLDA